MHLACGILEAEIIDGQGADNFSIGQILRDFRIKVIRFEKSWFDRKMVSSTKTIL